MYDRYFVAKNSAAVKTHCSSTAACRKYSLPTLTKHVLHMGLHDAHHCWSTRQYSYLQSCDAIHL